MKKAGMVIGGIVVIGLLVVLGVGLDVGSIKYQGFLSKLTANVQRQVHKESQSYNEGMEQQLLKLLHERFEKKASGDTDAVAALDFTIQHRYATYNEKNIDAPRLRVMLEEVKYGMTTNTY